MPVNSLKHSQWTPLYWAISRNQQAVCELLLDWPGCDPTARADAEKNTALHWAAQEGNLAALQAILQRFPRINLEMTGHMRSTPLLLAASYGKAEVTRELLKKGANVTARDSMGKTPALGAATSGNVETIKVFPRLRILHDRMLAPPAVAPYSMLHMAAKEGKLEACKAILAIAPELQRWRILGKTPKMVATESGHALVAAVL